MACGGLQYLYCYMSRNLRRGSLARSESPANSRWGWGSCRHHRSAAVIEGVCVWYLRVCPALTRQARGRMIDARQITVFAILTYRVLHTEYRSQIAHAIESSSSPHHRRVRSTEYVVCTSVHLPKLHAHLPKPHGLCECDVTERHRTQYISDLININLPSMYTCRTIAQPT